jgi:hypothetical protein
MTTEDDNELPISRDDIEIEVMSLDEDDEPCVYVKFSNFDSSEDADEYAEFLANTLPLLLFETIKVQ